MTDAPSTHPRRATRIIRELVETIVLTIVIFLVVRLAIQNFRVDGISMMSTVKSGDLVLVNKIDYLLSSPQRGDIIVFKPPVASEDYIKRIIGVPGDKVQIVANKGVWVNNKKLNEPYLDTAQCNAPRPTEPWLCETPGYDWGPATVPAGKYFVLGDDRNDSFDSHAWCSGNGPVTTRPCSKTWVSRSAIVGKALIAYWPLWPPPGDLKFFGF